MIRPTEGMPRHMRNTATTATRDPQINHRVHRRRMDIRSSHLRTVITSQQDRSLAVHIIHLDHHEGSAAVPHTLAVLPLSEADLQVGVEVTLPTCHGHQVKV